MSETGVPVIGQKVIAVLVPGATMYNGHEAVVTHAEPGYIRGEFKSIQKPDDTMSFGFSEWKPALWEIPDWDDRDTIIGKYAKVVYACNIRGHVGKVGKITGIFSRQETLTHKTNGITVNIEGITEWVQGWVPAEDPTGQTDGYRPALRDEVVITGYLDADGIHDNMYLTGVVTGIDGDVWTVMVDGREYISGPGYVAPVADGLTLTVSSPEGRESAATGIITDLQEKVKALESQLAGRDVTITRLREDLSKTYGDLSRIESRMDQEAENRNWCEEFDRIKDELNGEFESDFRFAEREQEFEVEVTISGNASTTRSIMVTARSQEDADEKVADDPSSYFDVEDALSEAVRYNGWDDTEVEVD